MVIIQCSAEEAEFRITSTIFTQVTLFVHVIYDIYQANFGENGAQKVKSSLLDCALHCEYNCTEYVVVSDELVTQNIFSTIYRV